MSLNRIALISSMFARSVSRIRAYDKKINMPECGYIYVHFIIALLHKPKCLHLSSNNVQTFNCRANEADMNEAEVTYTECVRLKHEMSMGQVWLMVLRQASTQQLSVRKTQHNRLECWD